MSVTVTINKTCKRELDMSEAKKTILIIDDDRSILRVFTRVFEKKGYSVLVAETGKKASELIKSNFFDAALIDVRLPDINGTDLLSQIHAASPKSVKIVFTGSPDVEFGVDSVAENMDAFLIKPVKPEILLSILEEKLKTK